jgi:hypothetical protein
MNFNFNFTRHNMITGLLTGFGIAYAVEQKLYFQIPLAIVFPFTYVGFHSYLFLMGEYKAASLAAVSLASSFSRCSCTS